MLLNAVIIILREVLEASLIISVFLALSQLLERNLWWVLFAMLMGIVGGFVYASTISQISAALEGVGQEVVNACLHTLIYLSLLLFVVAVLHPQNPRWHRITLISIIVAVIIAIAREGSEIILYISGFIGMPELLQPVLLGGAVGAGIGVSVGVFFYYLLVNMHPRYGLWLGYFILLLVAGSMMSQAVEFLIQADFITVTAPAWDSSGWISEHSAAGQLLYALIGYEATPAPVQVVVYFSSIGLLLLLSAISFYRHRRSN
ncbi:FTR1 family protein [Methylophaga sp. OBS4]|uniref:FTR1 family protein n=1 Tax=Methylophaga sp. OBS4 TaxID=2991935 RepID=UPI00225AEFD7|nr:FTR1 family protein [Methylophaga sp. OBS4]MCX4186849.1 FTR1 family protein [Methylophaga sp. OBS4]